MMHVDSDDYYTDLNAYLLQLPDKPTLCIGKNLVNPHLGYVDAQQKGIFVKASGKQVGKLQVTVTPGIITLDNIKAYKIKDAADEAAYVYSYRLSHKVLMHMQQYAAAHHLQVHMEIVNDVMQLKMQQIFHDWVQLPDAGRMQRWSRWGMQPATDAHFADILAAAQSWSAWSAHDGSENNAWLAPWCLHNGCMIKTLKEKEHGKRMQALSITYLNKSTKMFFASEWQEEDIAMLYKDAAGLSMIGQYMMEGNLDAAYALASDLDTLVRDEIPRSIWNYLEKYAVDCE